MVDEKSKRDFGNVDSRTGELLEILGKMSVKDPSPALVAHNFDIADENKLWDVMANATSGEADRASANLGETIELVNWFAHIVQPGSEAGKEARWACRTVFFDASGQAFSSVSTGVLASLILLIRCKGAGPWEEPTKIRFFEQKVGGGKTFLQFGPIPSSS